MTMNSQLKIQLDFVESAPRLALDRIGEGEVVLFLHGVGGNRSNWTRQLLAFGCHFEAVAWDMRGYGLSSDYDGPFDFKSAYGDIDRVLDHIGVQACHLVGLSLGGRIGFGYAYAKPERVLSLTACSAVPFSEDMHPHVRKKFLQARQKPLLEGNGPAGIAADVAAKLAGPFCSQDAFEQLTASMSILHVGSYLKMLEAISAPTVRYPFDEIRVPVHIIAAAYDTLFPASKLREIASAIKNARYTEMASAGHLSNLEFPEEFNQMALEFILAHRARA